MRHNLMALLLLVKDEKAKRYIEEFIEELRNLKTNYEDLFSYHEGCLETITKVLGE